MPTAWPARTWRSTFKTPAVRYDKARLRQAVEDMVAREGAHFTTEVFLAMNGHDISVAHPLESRIVADARELLAGQYEIEQTDLEGFWAAAEKHLDRRALPVLTGERRSYLKQGMWTFLFPGTISARTYLKQKDFDASTAAGRTTPSRWRPWPRRWGRVPQRYLDRGWRYLLCNHTHDANGGCAPDAVCLDMEYRYRKAADLADIATEDAMAHVAKGLAQAAAGEHAMQLVVYNPLPVPRDAVLLVDLEIPPSTPPRRPGWSAPRTPSVHATGRQQREVQRVRGQHLGGAPHPGLHPREVPRLRLTGLPALGYRAYAIVPEKDELRPPPAASLVAGPATMANERLRAEVNPDGTVNLTCKATHRRYAGLNYLADQGECGNAWKHVPPVFDRLYTSRGASASVAVTESGPLVAAIEAALRIPHPGRLRRRAAAERSAGAPAGAGGVPPGGRLPGAEGDAHRGQPGQGPLAPRVHADGPGGGCLVGGQPLRRAGPPIAVPDSTGWVERAYGTHPLRTFAGLTDGHDGLAVMPKGLYEYEAIDDPPRTLALTLIRACRIKLAVSEEKQTELPDEGIQCPGPRRFEYAIIPHAGDWRAARLLTEAAKAYVPVRAAMTGRGKGPLPAEMSLMTLDNEALHVTCVKQAEDGDGMIVRLFNPLEEPQPATLTFCRPI